MKLFKTKSIMDDIQAWLYFVTSEFRHYFHLEKCVKCFERPFNLSEENYMAKSFNYVDGIILPVPRKNLAKYKKWAKLAGKVWVDHGALSYVEAMADDVKRGKVTSFPQSVKLKAGEVVFFNWITYKSRADRDRIMKKVMSDPRLAEFMNEDDMPFDGMRMFWGGFKPVVKFT